VESQDTALMVGVKQVGVMWSKKACCV